MGKIQKTATLLLCCILFSISPAQTHIAVLELEGKGLSAVEASILTDRLRVEMFETGRFVVVEREMMEDILNEQGFQQTGCTSMDCIVEIGRLVGVEQIIGGSVNKFGDLYSVAVRIISVETGQIINTATYDHEGRLEDLLKLGMNQVAMQLTEKRSMAMEPEEIVPGLSAAEKQSSVIELKEPAVETIFESSGNARSPITTKRGVFTVSYLQNGNKLNRKDLQSILKMDPAASELLDASKRNFIMGPVIGLTGLTYATLIFIKTEKDYNKGLITDEESIDIELKAYLIASACALGQLYFLLKGNKQFLDAIDSYNENTN